MKEEIVMDLEKERFKREYLLGRKRDLFERQTLLANLLPKLIFPMIFMLIAMMLLEPSKNLMLQYERILAAEADGMERIPELRKQITILEKQLANLSGSSVEQRLANIERSIEVGDVDVDKVKTFQQLRSDFDILKTYMFSDPEDLVKLKTLQRDYQEVSSNIEKFVEKDVVDREISFLNNMFYTVLGFLGILISIAGGSWWATSKKFKSINTEELSKGGQQDAA